MSPDWSPSARTELVRSLPRRERAELRRKVSTIQGFAEGILGVELRPYQAEAAEAVVRSILARDGNSFVLLFARQSGKDELIANLILYLLARLAERGGSIVCAQPTFSPQTENAMDRLQARSSQRPFFTLGGLRRTHGRTFEFLAARATYLSADPSASVVGATADRLLIVNEAQDVSPSVYDKRFAPMAASGNATRLFSGTAWTGDTLLDREKRRALAAEKRDGVRRVFVVDGEQVAASNRFYAAFLEQELSRLGRDHPLVRTQYFCENVDARSGMFTAAHRALMAADRPAALAPEPGKTYAFLLDVAGQETSSTSYAASSTDGGIDPPLNWARDALTLRIVEIDLSTLETLRLPTYRGVYLQQWTGQNHLAVFGQLKSLAESWKPGYIVIDATGVGEGLWALLDKAFPTRVIPVKFTQAIKSQLGYKFLAAINTGRFKDCCGYGGDSRAAGSSPAEGRFPSRLQIDREYSACEAEILFGPLRTMRWGVPEGRRGEDGQLIHDDIPVTDSLVGALDDLEWGYSFEPFIIPGRDPLDDMTAFAPRDDL